MEAKRLHRAPGMSTSCCPSLPPSTPAEAPFQHHSGRASRSTSPASHLQLCRPAKTRKTVERRKGMYTMVERRSATHMQAELPASSRTMAEFPQTAFPMVFSRDCRASSATAAVHLRTAGSTKRNQNTHNADQYHFSLNTIIITTLKRNLYRIRCKHKAR